MRILLIILLILAGIANVVAALPLLNIPAAPLALKVAPFVFAICAIVSAVMLMRRSANSFVPFLIGFLVVLAANVTYDGFSAVPKAGLGFVILVLFFLPAVRNSKSGAISDEARNG